MSNEVYPQLPGLAYGVRRFPMWSTDVRTTPSQREYRSSDQIYPRRRLRLEYEFLRDVLNAEHVQTLEGFFNRHRGRLESFLVNDPDDNTISSQVFGVTDGSTSTFQLVRARGNFIEPVSALQAGTENVRWISSTEYRGPDTPLYLGSRTNNFLRSTEFNSGSWSKTNMPVTQNATPAPDGSSDADLLVPSTTSGVHSVAQSVNFDASTPYVTSFYLKTAGVQWVKLRAYNAGFAASAWANFDIVNGVVGLTGETSSAAVLDAYKIAAVPGWSGWFRVEIAAHFLSANTSGGCYLAALDGDVAGAFANYASNGTDGLYAWLGQHEIGRTEAGWPIRTSNSVVTRTDVSANDAALLTFTSAPPTGATLSWSGSYYWRARFEADELDFEKFLDGLWRTSRVDLLTTRS